MRVSNTVFANTKMRSSGPIRESNSGPPAPEAGIIPLDQLDTVNHKSAGGNKIYK
jgi:hypothetical protein